MMIDRYEAQKCYTQQDSNFNGLFTASQKIDGFTRFHDAVCGGERISQLKKARLRPALPLVHPEKGGTIGRVVWSMTTRPLCGAMSVSPKELSVLLRSDLYPRVPQVDGA
jgi:hypothetical protein